MVWASFSFAAMSVFVKLSGNLPAYEKVLFRSSFSMLVLFFIIRSRRASYFGQRKHQGKLIARSLMGTIAMVMFFYSIPRIYLADHAMITRLNPFFVTLFAYLFLGEKLSKMQWPALFLVFGAAALIIKPSFRVEILPYLVTVGGAVISAGGYTLLRDLRNKELPVTIIFYFSFTTTVVLLPFVFFDFIMPQGIEWLYLVCIGIMAVSGQLGLTYAYRFWKASEVSIYSYSGIIFSALGGWMIYGEIPDVWSIIGGLMIIAVALAIYFKG